MAHERKNQHPHGIADRDKKKILDDFLLQLLLTMSQDVDGRFYLGEL